MKATVVRPDELGASEIAAWCAMQRTTPDLLNPFLSPAFAQAVSRVRPDTRVAVLEDGGQLAGFFGFQQARMRTALPLAAGVSDGQAIVHVPGLEWDPVRLLTACNLDVWEFDHLLSAQVPLLQRAARQRVPAECAHLTRRDSPIIDVSRGFEAYAEHQRRSTRRSFRTTLYKERKLAREVGPVEVTFDTPDPDVLRLLLKWKSAQYRRTGRRDRFATGWIERLVWDLFDHGRGREHRRPTLPRAQNTHIHDGCRGTLTVLRAGDRIVAVHFGLRSSRSLSCWFPAYDPELARYSPGLVLHLRMAEAAAEAGLDHLDLGKGDEIYKQWLKTGDLTVCEGAVYRPSMAAVMYGARRMPVRYASNFVLRHQRLRRVARSTLARVGRIRSAVRTAT